ncbi:transcriptional regulator, partial [Escherichia coli]|nr:transcriptional regulator [Escherichia coli]
MTEVRRLGSPGQSDPVAEKGSLAIERGIANLENLEKSGGS